jgi:hypothetical protein
LDGSYSVDSKKREKDEKAARKAAKLANPKKRRAVDEGAYPMFSFNLHSIVHEDANSISFAMKQLKESQMRNGRRKWQWS